MMVRVHYFAAAQDLVSRRSEDMELAEGASVSVLADQILRAHPSLQPLRGSIRYSVNLVVVPNGTALKSGDEVGVLPPVAGG
jgi:molybdopterin converting factor small subunit